MIGILSDAHGNFPAFDKAINILRREGATRFVFLGDAIGYLPTPLVLVAIQRLGKDIDCICGNHEDIFLKGIVDSERDLIYQHHGTRHQINQVQLEFIKSWPVRSTKTFDIGSALFVHGSPLKPIYGYVYPNTDLADFEVEERFVFMGHTHRPFMRQHLGTTFVNVGSCGLPRDYGTLGSVALFDELTGNVRILRFDITQETQMALASIGAVHSSIYSLLARKTEEIIGELIEI